MNTSITTIIIMYSVYSTHPHVFLSCEEVDIDRETISLHGQTEFLVSVASQRLLSLAILSYHGSSTTFSTITAHGWYSALRLRWQA